MQLSTSTAQLSADSSSADTWQRYGAAPAILEAVKQWETARTADAFSPSVRVALRDNDREFHLATVGINQWDLYEEHITRFVHTNGQVAATQIQFQNPYSAQPLQWTVCSTAKEPVAVLTLEIDGESVVVLRSCSLPPGGNLKYKGENYASITDATWREVGRVPVKADADQVGVGPHRAQLTASLRPGASLRVELRTLGWVDRIRSPGGTAK